MQTPLHKAVINNHINAVRLLLKHGANPNSINKKGYTPLHYASGRGYLDIMKLLLDYNASLTIYSSTNALSIHFAIHGGLEAFQLLLDHGANMNSPNYNNVPMINLVSSFDKSSDILKLLIDNGADINNIDIKYGTPLHAASFFNNMKTATLLIDSGIDINAVVTQAKITAYKLGNQDKSKGRDVANMLYKLMNNRASNNASVPMSNN
jgi:ankyrin repeat protein